MTTVDFITELFCRIDDGMKNTPKHAQANLYPSEIIILAILSALKGVRDRAFSAGSVAPDDLPAAEKQSPARPGSKPGLRKP